LNYRVAHSNILSGEIMTNYENRLIEDSARYLGQGPEHVYAYTFPTYVENSDNSGRIRIKIGMTRKKTAEQRVYDQIGTSSAEKGILLLVANADNAAAVEDHIHTRLKSKSRNVANSPGQEWFWTTVPEIIQLAKEKEPQLDAEYDPQEVLREWAWQEFKETWIQRFAWVGFGTCCYWGYLAYNFASSL